MNAPLIVDAPRPVKLTVDDFILLFEAGALNAYPRAELLDGTITSMSPQGSRHMVAKNLLYRRLADACDALGRGLEAWSEGTIAMPAHHAPEPDLFVTNQRPTTGFTASETVVLVGEVADTTLAHDLGPKARMYAAAGIPEYWVVDVEGGSVHQLWAPGPEGYAERREVALGERVEAVTVAGLSAETGGLV